MLANPASAMKRNPELFCIMIYYLRVPTKWLTQLLLGVASDVEPNPDLAQVCTMPEHVKIGAGIHVTHHNITPTQTSIAYKQQFPSNNAHTYITHTTQT